MNIYSKVILSVSLLAYGCNPQRVGQTLPTEEPTPSVDELIGMFESPNHNDRVDAAYDAGYYEDDGNKVILLPYLVDALSGPDFSDRGGRKEFATQSIRMFEVYD